VEMLLDRHFLIRKIYIEKALGVNPCPETSPKKHFNVISEGILHINKLDLDMIKYGTRRSNRPTYIWRLQTHDKNA